MKSPTTVLTLKNHLLNTPAPDLQETPLSNADTHGFLLVLIQQVTMANTALDM